MVMLIGIYVKLLIFFDLRRGDEDVFGDCLFDLCIGRIYIINEDLVLCKNNFGV